MTLSETVSQAFRAHTGLEVAVDWRCDRKGVRAGWCLLQDASQLLRLARALASLQARLCMITASLSGEERRRRELAYHFDLDGATLTVTVPLPIAGAEVPSLAAIFRNADWNERELMELYDVAVTGHPDPRPLFIDKSAGKNLFERLVPYSSFTNGACSSTLWEQVMAAQAAKEKP